MGRRIQVTKTLPDKPSELILVALKDLEKLENRRGIVIDMGEWLTENVEGGKKVCSVCMAGAVMYNRLGIRPHDDPDSMNLITPGDLSDEATSAKLSALNHFRMGDINVGLVRMGLSCSSLPANLTDGEELSDLSFEDRPEWKNHMLDLAGILQAEGL